jgi:ribosomal protein S8
MKKRFCEFKDWGKILGVGILSLSINSSWANGNLVKEIQHKPTTNQETILTAENFAKNFRVVRNNDGKLISIEMRFFKEKFNLKTYLQELSQDIKNLKTVQKNGLETWESMLVELNSELNQELSLLTNKNDQIELEESISWLNKALHNLFAVENSELDSILADDFFSIYERDLKETLSLFSLSVIARPNENRYFFARKGLETLLEKALEMAAKKFSHVPWLNLVSSLVVRVHDMLWQQRNFNQYMLLHYLEQIPEAQLGLTLGEADLIFSSIYESRISFGDILSSNQAAQNWTQFGISRFYTELRAASKRARVLPLTNLSRLNFAFAKVPHRNQELANQGHFEIWNLRDPQHRFTSKLSLAYDSAKPQKVAQTRLLISLGEMGLGLAPVPAWIKGQVESFLKSFYRQHTQTEGALMGHSELAGNTHLKSVVRVQSLNPFF